MRKHINIIIKKLAFLVVLVLVFMSPAVAQAIRAKRSQSTIKLGYVTLGNVGCGSYIYRNEKDSRENRFLYIESIDDGKPLVNINGKDVELTYIKSGGFSDNPNKVGDREWSLYSAGDVNIRIDQVVTWMCPVPDKSESCEVTYYKVKMTITRKNERLIIYGRGSLGC